MAERSCNLDQSALLQVGESFANIGENGRNIDVVFAREVASNLGYRISLAAGENRLGGFVELENSFRKNQDTSARGTIDLQADSAGKTRPCTISSWRSHDELNRGSTKGR